MELSNARNGAPHACPELAVGFSSRPAEHLIFLSFVPAPIFRISLLHIVEGHTLHGAAINFGESLQ
jgi:hypothetical protein